MAKYKNIRIKKKGGGTRLQRVQVLASGKYKFVKNKKGSTKRSPKKRSTKKKRSTRKSGGSPVTRKNTSRKEVPLFQVIAGAMILDAGTGGAFAQMAEAFLTWIATHLTSGEYVVKNYSLADDWNKFISTSISAWRSHTVPSTGSGWPPGGDTEAVTHRAQTIRAVAKAGFMVWAWRAGLKWANRNAPIVRGKIPKSIPIGAYKVVIR